MTYDFARIDKIHKTNNTSLTNIAYIEVLKFFTLPSLIGVGLIAEFLFFSTQIYWNSQNLQPLPNIFTPLPQFNKVGERENILL